MRRWTKTILAILTLVSLSPLIAMLLASAVAGLLDGPLDEGGQYPCRLGGVDIGEALHIGFVSAWFMFLTWPGVLVCLAAWIVLGLRWLARRWRRRVRPA